MDDCSLEKLTVKPGKLSPVFQKNIVDYSVIVASNVYEIKIDPLTSDSGASYSISDGDGGKTVPLQEGVITDIKIEVTAEDGTIKIYVIHVTRLSAKDATLDVLKTSSGALAPDFDPQVQSYTCLVPCNIENITFTATSTDSKKQIVVRDASPEQAIRLNIGETQTEIEVTSADGSTQQVYAVQVIRKVLPRYVKLSDAALGMKYECPISLSPLHCPISTKITIATQPIHMYSAMLIDELTKTFKYDLLSGQALETGWRQVESEIDAGITSAQGCIPLISGGLSEPKTLAQIGSQLSDCDKLPEPLDLTEVLNKTTQELLKHTVQVRTWEKQLRQQAEASYAGQSSSTEKLSQCAQEELKKYFSCLLKPASEIVNTGAAENLKQAAYAYVLAIHQKPKDSNLHLHLAEVLEEMYHADEVYNMMQQTQEDKGKSPCEDAARESGKEDECAAICALHGVPAGAPLTLQLKAIDEEFQHLRDTGQAGKSDHVQGLYAWKSKQALKSNLTGVKVSDEESYLGQAYLKYLDALALDDAKAVNNFHVGRLLCMQGNYSEALRFLESALRWNPQFQPARVYLGMTLILHKDRPKERLQEMVSLMKEGINILLSDVTKYAMSEQEQSFTGAYACLFAENTLTVRNYLILQAILELGKLQNTTPMVDCMESKYLFHTVALLSAYSLPTLPRGQTYQKFLFLLLDAHSMLLDQLLSAPGASQKALIYRRCACLAGLLRAASNMIGQNQRLLAMQEEACRALLYVQPCSSDSLTQYGNLLISQYNDQPDEDKVNVLLSNAEAAFLASIDLEGKTNEGEAPEWLTGLSWWQEKSKSNAPTKSGAASAPAQGQGRGRGAPTSSKDMACTRGRGAAGQGAAATPMRGGAAAGRGASTTARGAATAGGRGASTATRGATRGGSVAARGGKSGPAANAKSEASSSSAKTAPAPANSSKVIDPVLCTLPVATNCKTYHPRLGLARVHRARGDTDKAQCYYKEAIGLNTKVHDAYIEAGEMLSKTDAQAAIDIYTQFPMTDEPSFDDAYIYGEVVRLLMKQEAYDDPRLASHMIGYGRVLGLGVLDKHLKILEDKFKSTLLKTVYAGVNYKSVDDPDLEAFFKFKLWI